MNIKICNMCEREFTDNDYLNGGFITDNLTGNDDFDLCSDCYHKIMKILIPRCKVQPFMGEIEDGYDEGYGEDEELNNE